jgi:hypothetical protein
VIGVVEEKALVCFHPVRNTLRVIETIDPDERFTSRRRKTGQLVRY